MSWIWGSWSLRCEENGDFGETLCFYEKFYAYLSQDHFPLCEKNFLIPAKVKKEIFGLLQQGHCFRK